MIENTENIVSTTFYTIDRILENTRNGPDALVLYFKYIQQTRIQRNNQSFSLDQFMMKKMERGKERFYKAKGILKDLGLIEVIRKRNENGIIEGTYIKTNFIINMVDDTTTIPVSHPPVEPPSGKQDTNTLEQNINTLEQNINTISDDLSAKQTLSNCISIKQKKQTVDFEQFRNLYDKKVGRPKAEAKRYKLKYSEQTQCLEKLPAYLATIKDKQYQKHPLTYLNQRSREDEIYSNAPDYEKLDQFDKQMSIDVQPIKDWFSKKYGPERQAKYSETKQLWKHSDLYLK